MDVAQPLDPNYPLQHAEINANTLFGGGYVPQLETPVFEDSVIESPPDFIDIDELVDFPSEGGAEQAKFGILGHARAIRSHISDAGYRVGEALMVAKMDLPARHEHASIKDATKATGKSIGSSSANIVSQAVLQNRTGDVLRAVREDYNESDHKLRVLSLGAAVVATEIADRGRIMVFVIPKVVTDVLTNTESPVQAGLAGAGAFTLWNVLTSSILSNGLNQLPKAKEAIRQKFPVAVSMFKDALPGANKELAEAKKVDAQDHGRVRRVGSFLLRHGARGGTGINLGTTAFVATSSIDGDSLKETRKQYLGVSADTAVVTGLTIAGVGQALFEMPKHGLAAQSEWIYNGATDMRTWGAFALVTMGLQFNDSRIYKKKLVQREAEAENEPIILDEQPMSGAVIDMPITKHKNFTNQIIAG